MCVQLSLKIRKDISCKNVPIVFQKCNEDNKLLSFIRILLLHLLQIPYITVHSPDNFKKVFIFTVNKSSISFHIKMKKITCWCKKQEQLLRGKTHFLKFSFREKLALF